MAKPVLLAVDDEPQVLQAVARDLLAQYGSDYRVITVGSGREALDVVRRLSERDDLIGLFLVDQRMPEMTGTEFLASARQLFPETPKVLLTAYADTQAAIDSINSIGLDYYLMKPWDPPEQHLYPIIDELLDAWSVTVRQPYDGIRVAGTGWSSQSHYTKDFLARNRIPYRWLDIEEDARARAQVEAVAGGEVRLPVVFFPDDEPLVQPERRALAERLGLQVEAQRPFYDVVIVGGGPAGLTSAVYGAAEGMRTAMIEREAPGGQAGTSALIENYMGFPAGISGAELARRAVTQARRLGAEILTARSAVEVRVEDPYRIVVLDDGTELPAHTVVIATGMTVRELPAAGVERLTGAGVYYSAAVTEAASHRGEEIYVVGAGNSAGQGAVFLARYAERVTLMVRGDSIEAKMSVYLANQIEATEKIRVLTRTEVQAVHGERQLESLTLMDATGETEQVPAGALFIFIGAMPHSQLVQGIVALNDKGFILTGPDLARDGRRRPGGWPLERDPYLLETSVPGIFAAGDVRHGYVKRVSTAVGEGSLANSFIERYLETV